MTGVVNVEDEEPVDTDGDGVPDVDDCDPYDASVYPGAPELADGLDNDCDGVVDEGTDTVDDDGDGYSEDEGDCDDENLNVNPGETEIANGVDDNCDGTIDEGTDTFDDDGDGYSEDEGDCDDSNSSVNPGAVEVADNGIDDDCDGITDPDDGGEEIEFDPIFTELEIVMETVTNGEMTTTAELGGEAANELRYGLWWLYEMMTGGEMDEANATINVTVVAAFITLMSGGQEEVDSGFQLNGVSGAVVPGIPSVSPMDALLGSLVENHNESITVTMSQALSFDVEDPGDSPAYFFEGDGTEDNETIPVEINYRFVAPSGWVIASAEVTDGTIDIDGRTAVFVLPAGELLPDMTITLGQPLPYDCDDAATYCVTISDYAFTPSELAVEVGDSVVFVWDATVDAHNVAQVADANAMAWNNGFRSGDIIGGSGYWMLPAEATAADATLYYVCEPHATMGMRGSITVGNGDEPVDDGGNDGEPLDDDSGLPGPGIVLVGAALVGAAMRRRH
jgi:plastocyanin